jgi:hypothetical protein
VPVASAMQGAHLEPTARTTNSTSTSAQAARSRPEEISGTHVDRTIEEEAAVDVLATAAFNDELQLDIGCFGNTSRSYTSPRQNCAYSCF